ncbi:MAG: glycosyltransferase [Bacteroidota bacterium]
MSFDHFLITRFNLRYKEWSATKNGINVTSSDWLNKRFELFNAFCLPSVLNQSNKNFKWIICFDIDTSPKFKSIIKELSEEHFFIIPVFIDDGYNSITVLRKTIEDNQKTDNEYLITSRLDNDDSIHKDFIRGIQNAFDPKEGLVIDLVNGYQLMLPKNRKTLAIRRMRTPYNHFLSLVESTSYFNTIFQKWHLDWKVNITKTVESDGLWLQVIHDSNLVNDELLHFKETNAINLSDFGISGKFKLKTKRQLIFSNIFSLLKRIQNKLKF